jgi:hypothetical protein
MNSSLAVVVMLAVLPVGSGKDASCVGTEVTLSRTLDRAFGVVMAVLIRPGMRRDQANILLGSLLVEEGQFGGDACYKVFRRYGFSVCEHRGPDGVWRVTEVKLVPQTSPWNSPRKADCP